jgi:hypothetical protein
VTAPVDVAVATAGKPSRWRTAPMPEPSLKPRRHAVRASEMRQLKSPAVVIATEADARAITGVTPKALERPIANVISASAPPERAHTAAGRPAVHQL